MKEREKRTMLLTRKMLNTILRNHRVQISAELKNELLEQYGNLVVTEDGRVIGYSEQDICEQLRKLLRPSENANKEVINFTLT
jgi:hypothetical protein